MSLPTLRFARCLAHALALLSGVFLAGLTLADTIAIIGTGRVAGALGPQFAKQGHTIVYGSREPEREEVAALVARTGGSASASAQAEAAAGADIVVIAVPGAVAEEVVRGLGDLSGKIILDPTNRTEAAADGLRVHGVATSNAELIQAAAPGARVVKAFNTLNFRTMETPEISGGPVTIPIVGDDTEAKRKIAALAEGMGFEAMDLGPLRYANTLEEMLVIWVNARSMGTPYDYYFRRQATE
jgi:predicted dinucleotide-binding enzyme